MISTLSRLQPFRLARHQGGLLSVRRQEHAFSLVEVVLAIGVVAFAFLAIFSLLPVGLGVFRQAMETSVGAQIVQRVVSDAQQTDFDTLVGNVVGDYYSLPVRYFDDQGSEVTSSSPNAVYTVRVRGSRPGGANPEVPDPGCFVKLPSLNPNPFNPRDLTVLTIQIANNPSNKDLTSLVSASQLFDPVKTRQANLSVQTFSAAIVRNGKTLPGQ